MANITTQFTCVTGASPQFILVDENGDDWAGESLSSTGITLSHSIEGGDYDVYVLSYSAPEGFTTGYAKIDDGISGDPILREVLAVDLVEKMNYLTAPVAVSTEITDLDLKIGDPVDDLATDIAGTGGGRIWYVAASGGDDGGPGTRNNPFDTIAYAITQAVAGDTVHLLTGTYSEVLTSTTADVHFRGDGWGTHISTAATCVTLVNGNTLSDMKVTSTDETAYGISAISTLGVKIRNVYATGPKDAITVKYSYYCDIDGFLGYGGADGVNFGAVTGLRCRNFYIKGKGTNSTNNPTRGIYCPSAIDIELRNGTVEAESFQATVTQISAIGGSGDFFLENVNLIAGSPVYAMDTDGINDMSGPMSVIMIGGKITTTSGGGGTPYDLDMVHFADSVARLSGVNCDPAKFKGTPTIYSVELPYGMQVDMTQAVPVSNDPQTVGDCHNAARAQGFGRWVIDEGGGTITLYAGDDITPVKVFNITPNFEAPTTRTPV